MNLPEVLIAILVFIRVLRWVSIFQQKEYRLDRLMGFLKTKEGRVEVFKLINLPTNLHQVKRPVMTTKSLGLLLTTAALCWYLLDINDHLIYQTFVYIFAPVLVLFSYLPWWVVTLVIKTYYLIQARRLVSKHHPMIIGITGSYGKTSTRKLIAYLLTGKYKVWTPPDSHNTPLVIAKDFLQSYANEEILIIEYAAYTIGEIANLCRVFPPTMGVLTGLTYQHLGLFGSFANLKQAKGELLHSLPNNTDVFYNATDRELAKLVLKFNNLNLQPIYKGGCSTDHQGRLMVTQGSKNISTTLIGKHYAINVRLAIAVSRKLDISNVSIRGRLSDFKPDRYFIRTYKLKTGALVIDDGGTSNPRGFTSALDLCEQLNYRSKIMVTGGIIDLGRKSASIHRELCARSAQIFAHVFFTAEHEKYIWQQMLGVKWQPLNQLATMLRQSNAQTLWLIEGKLPPSVIKIISHYANTDL